MEDDICNLVSRNLTELDASKRIENNIKVQDYMSHWMVNSPIAQLTTYFVARPEVVQWEPYMTSQEEFNSPHTVVMK